jgi:hypothetical protein
MCPPILPMSALMILSVVFISFSFKFGIFECWGIGIMGMEKGKKDFSIFSPEFI